MLISIDCVCGERERGERGGGGGGGHESAGGSIGTDRNETFAPTSCLEKLKAHVQSCISKKMI